MKSLLNVLAIVALLIGGCASSQESSSRVGYDFSGVDKVAIVAVEGALSSESAKDQIADFFSIELLDKGYAPIGRAQVRSQLREKEPESENLTTTEAAVEVGLILDVPAVLAIQIPHFAEEISITATMINVEDGSTLWLASESGRGKRVLSGMFGFSSSRRGDDQLLNNVMVGPMGMAPSQPLTPEEARAAQEIISSMCRSLPAQSMPTW